MEEVIVEAPVEQVVEVELPVVEVKVKKAKVSNDICENCESVIGSSFVCSVCKVPFVDTFGL